MYVKNSETLWMMAQHKTENFLFQIKLCNAKGWNSFQDDSLISWSRVWWDISFIIFVFLTVFSDCAVLSTSEDEFHSAPESLSPKPSESERIQNFNHAQTLTGRGAAAVVFHNLQDGSRCCSLFFLKTLRLLCIPSRPVGYGSWESRYYPLPNFRCGRWVG